MAGEARRWTLKGTDDDNNPIAVPLGPDIPEGESVEVVEARGGGHGDEARERVAQAIWDADQRKGPFANDPPQPWPPSEDYIRTIYERRADAALSARGGGFTDKDRKLLYGAIADPGRFVKREVYDEDAQLYEPLTSWQVRAVCSALPRPPVDADRLLDAIKRAADWLDDLANRHAASAGIPGLIASRAHAKASDLRDELHRAEAGCHKAPGSRLKGAWDKHEATHPSSGRPRSTEPTAADAPSAGAETPSAVGTPRAESRSATAATATTSESGTEGATGPGEAEAGVGEDEPKCKTCGDRGRVFASPQSSPADYSPVPCPDCSGVRPTEDESRATAEMWRAHGHREAEDRIRELEARLREHEAVAEALKLDRPASVLDSVSWFLRDYAREIADTAPHPALDALRREVDTARKAIADRLQSGERDS